MTTDKTGGPAHPVRTVICERCKGGGIVGEHDSEACRACGGSGTLTPAHTGMTVLDAFAIEERTMPPKRRDYNGILVALTMTEIVQWRYKCAEAMLAEKQRRENL